jgi:hypothetical protein
VTRRLVVWIVLGSVTVVSAWAQGSVNTIRAGAFPNITHPQALEA